MNPPFSRRFKDKTLLFLFISSLAVPALCEESSSPSEMQFVMVGNTLAAINELPASATDSVQSEAFELERQIMLRKLADQDTLSDVPQAISKPLAEKKAAVSVLSKGSFFADFDEEIIDPLSSADNFDQFRMRLLDFLDFSIGIYGEYDDNIFLTPNNKVSDWKTIVNQSLEIKYPMDTFYLEVLYAVNLDIYGKSDEVVDAQNANFRLSYYPFDRLSMAVSDSVVKVGNSNVGTVFGDQTLSLGYWTNNLTTQLQYELWKQGYLEFTWNFDHIDFSNDRVKRFINRDVHVLDTKLKHRFTPVFSNYLGYKHRDVVFGQYNLKDSNSNILYYGADYEFPGLFTASGEIAYEDKSFDHPQDVITFLPGVTLPVTRRRANDGNVNFKVALESNLSRFNTIGLSYESRLVDSSRPEFSQYLGKTFGVNSRTFLDNKTILFSSLFCEWQDFNDDDAISVFFLGGDATTKVYASGVTLRRILNEWLYFDVGYTYVKRDSDFAGESSKNNRFRFGAHATF